MGGIKGHRWRFGGGGDSLGAPVGMSVDGHTCACGWVCDR